VKRLLVVTALALVASSGSMAAQELKLDGNAWRELRAGDRLAFAAGLLAGVNRLSWMLSAGDDALSPAEADKLTEILPRYVEGISGEQLRDGLNVLCEDPRNRRINVVSAALVVVWQIKGRPQTEIDALTERLRAGAK
jgi:hypothetical protein